MKQLFLASICLVIGNLGAAHVLPKDPMARTQQDNKAIFGEIATLALTLYETTKSLPDDAKNINFLDDYHDPLMQIWNDLKAIADNLEAPEIKWQYYPEIINPQDQNARDINANGYMNIARLAQHLSKRLHLQPRYFDFDWRQVNNVYERLAEELRFLRNNIQETYMA